jgi:fumarylacetoacetase
MKPGDVLGTGTLSAPHSGGLGSLLEKSEMGKKPFSLGEHRKAMTFLQDGDSVRITGFAKGKGYSIGFGECEGKVLAALPTDQM